MNLFDQAILLLTGLTAIYLVWRFFQDYQKNGKPMYDIYYMLSFLVLLVAGLLLIIFTYAALANPLVVVVAYLIPFLLALGLVTEFHKDKATLYLIVGLIGLVAIAYTRFTDAGALKVISLATFHSIAGLIIFFIPIFLIKNKKVDGGFIWVTVGGTLIGLGGIALAFIKSGSQLLFFSPELVMKILAPLLLLMTLAYTWGFMKKMYADK